MLRSLLHSRYLQQSDRTCGNLVAQTSAATVDHHAHLPFVVDAHLPGSIFVVNVIHNLDLGIMISRSQGPQLPITTCWSDSASKAASGSTGESYGNMGNRANCYSKVLVLEKFFREKKNPHINWKEVEHSSIITVPFVQIYNCFYCWNKTAIKQKDQDLQTVLLLTYWANKEKSCRITCLSLKNKTTSGWGNATRHEFQYQVLTEGKLIAPGTLGRPSIVSLHYRSVKNYSETAPPSHLSPCPEMLGRVSRKDTKLENDLLTFIFEPWEHSQPSWNTTLPEAGPSSLLLRKPCWGQPEAFFHIPHSAPCPLPRHSLPGETSPHPSLVPLPNPCNHQTPT